MVFPGKNPSEDREMQHGIRETVQMAPGRVGPVFPQAPMPGPSMSFRNRIPAWPRRRRSPTTPTVPRIPT